MITLYRKAEDPAADKIEERFRDLVLSYKNEISENDAVDTKLPRIEENGNIIYGEKQIEDWLIELEEELNWQRSLSGDGCYIDPKSGKVC